MAMSIEPSGRRRDRRATSAPGLPHVIAYPRGEGHQAPGVHQQLAVGKLLAHHGPARVREAPAVPAQPLQDEPFAAEQPRGQGPREGDVDERSARRAQEGVLLKTIMYDACPAGHFLREISRVYAATVGGTGSTDMPWEPRP
jgi:hypothetical protein